MLTCVIVLPVGALCLQPGGAVLAVPALAAHAAPHASHIRPETKTTFLKFSDSNSDHNVAAPKRHRAKIIVTKVWEI